MSDRLFSPSQREGFGRPFSDAGQVYLGDDDKDIEAFEVAHRSVVPTFSSLNWHKSTEPIMS